MYRPKKLFGSGTRVKILKLLLQSNPQQEYFIREICRRTNTQVNAVRMELKNLEQLGIVKARNDYPKIYYRVNDGCAMVENIKPLILQ